MWTAPSHTLPAAETVVAAVDENGLFCAVRPMQEPDSDWFECSRFGDYVWEGDAPTVREPLYWTHLPKLDGK